MGCKTSRYVDMGCPFRPARSSQYPCGALAYLATSIYPSPRRPDHGNFDGTHLFHRERIPLRLSTFSFSPTATCLGSRQGCHLPVVSDADCLAKRTLRRIDPSDDIAVRQHGSDGWAVLTSCRRPMNLAKLAAVTQVGGSEEQGVPRAPRQHESGSQTARPISHVAARVSAGLVRWRLARPPRQS